MKFITNGEGLYLEHDGELDFVCGCCDSLYSVASAILSKLDSSIELEYVESIYD